MDVKFGDLTKNMKYVVSNIGCGNEATILIRVNVGSRDEVDSIKGISHCLEHMFFRGTEKYPTQNDLTTEIHRCGGDFNAYTSKDSTVFHITVSKKCIEKAVEIISDAFYNSLFREEDLEKEKKIVINEINDNLSDPETVMQYGLDELVFKNTRLEKDIAGSVKTVKKITINMLKNFINTYYTNNVVVSLSGNINVKKGISLIKKYFHKNVNYPIQKNTIITKDKERILYLNYMKKQKYFQTKYISKKVEQSFIGIGFPSYEYKNDKKYVISIITDILAGYLGSRLYQRLRGKHGLVYDIDIEVEDYSDLSQTYVTCSTKNELKSIIKSIVIILQELNKIKFDTITDKELKNSISNHVENIKNLKNDNEYLADKYARDLSYYGHIIPLGELIKKYKAVTKKEICEVAKELFRKEKCSICYTATNKIILQ